MKESESMRLQVEKRKKKQTTTEALDKEDTLKDDKKYNSEEKRRRQAFREEQELRSFEERGGFAGVLKDLFRPEPTNGLELDNVNMLQNLCSGYYSKKYHLDKNLVQALDALSNERP